MSFHSRLWSSAVLSCVIGGAIACSSSSGSTSDPDASAPLDGSSNPDASSTPDGGTDTGSVPDASAMCTSIANGAPVVTSSIMSGVAAPAGTGGAIADGTYFMTAQIQYTGGDTNPEPQQYTMKITGGQADLTGHSKTAADQSFTVAMTANSATGAMKWTVVCPTANAGKDFGVTSYTATATTIHVYKPTNDAIFTKQ